MQVDDICLLKLRQACNVCACIGYIDCEKIVLLKAVGFPDDNAFPHKPPYLPPVTLQTYYADLVGLLVAHQHFGFDTVVFQRFHQAACCDGRSAQTFGSIDY